MKNFKSHAELDNYSRQLNPEHDAYWQSRGYNSRPDNWRILLDQEGLTCREGKVCPK